MEVGCVSLLLFLILLCCRVHQHIGRLAAQGFTNLIQSCKLDAASLALNKL